MFDFRCSWTVLASVKCEAVHTADAQLIYYPEDWGLKACPRQVVLKLGEQPGSGSHLTQVHTLMTGPVSAMHAGSPVSTAGLMECLGSSPYGLGEQPSLSTAAACEGHEASVLSRWGRIRCYLHTASHNPYAQDGPLKRCTRASPALTTSNHNCTAKRCTQMTCCRSQWGSDAFCMPFPAGTHTSMPVMQYTTCKCCCHGSTAAAGQQSIHEEEAAATATRHTVKAAHRDKRRLATCLAHRSHSTTLQY